MHMEEIKKVTKFFVAFKRQEVAKAAGAGWKLLKVEVFSLHLTKETFASRLNIVVTTRQWLMYSVSLTGVSNPALSLAPFLKLDAAR